MLNEIVEVIAEISQMMNKNISEEQVADRISRKKKYNKNVIAAAYSWLHEKKQIDTIEKSFIENQSEGIRTFTNEEVNQIGLTNYNYILHFYNTGLLTNNELESIIEELKYFPENTITPEQINLLILSTFLNLDNSTLPGSRLLLYSSDTIN